MRFLRPDFFVYFLMILLKFDLWKGMPLWVRNKVCMWMLFFILGLELLRYRFMYLQAILPIGTTLSFLPLPLITLKKPFLGSMSYIDRFINSDVLIPVEYNTSNIALSLKPAIVFRLGLFRSFKPLFWSLYSLEATL